MRADLQPARAAAVGFLVLLTAAALGFTQVQVPPAIDAELAGRN